MCIEFEIKGRPVPKARPRFSSGRVYTPIETLRAEKQIEAAYRQAGGTIVEGPIKITCIFTFLFPSKPSKKVASGGIWHTLRPDADNLVKLVMDALNGVAYVDDSQVSSIIVLKQYGKEAKTEIKIEKLKKHVDINKQI